MDSTCGSSGKCLTASYVVRHTFIDVVDVPRQTPLRTRASSDSDLYSKCPFEELPSLSDLSWKQPAEHCGASDRSKEGLAGLSDAETLSLDGELVEEGHLPCCASSNQMSDTQSEVGTECGAASAPLSQWSCTNQSKASSGKNFEAGDGQHMDLHAERAISLEAENGQATLQVNVEKLLSENLRLQMENRLLRDGFVASAPGGDYVSRQSSDQLPPEQLNAKADDRTTVMLRNLPNNYTRDMVLSMLDEEGFTGLYDFLYLPIDFKSGACLGYAFVNLVDRVVAAKFWRAFNGYRSWVVPSRKVCHITWSGPHQGLEAHIERYRNSPIMHESVPDECKPVLFQDGVRAAFPTPTKATKAPRVRKQTPQQAADGRAQHSHRRFNMY